MLGDGLQLERPLTCSPLPPPNVAGLLRRRQSPLVDPMQRAQDLMFAGTVAQGTITGFNKGGLIVELDGEELKGEGLGAIHTYTRRWTAPGPARPPAGGRGSGKRGMVLAKPWDMLCLEACSFHAAPLPASAGLAGCHASRHHTSLCPLPTL
jgi:hypothetical protein